jgi:3-hydroxyacyl-CoA dehydrogenase/enoyl-CoA hydratase/3-hydroxybutyryl-CoA epimerase
MNDTFTVKHWHLKKDSDNIVWLHFDKADTGTNVLSGEVLEELNLILTEVTKENPSGLIILSDKPGGFIAGADIKEFTQLQDTSQAAELIMRGQSVLDRLEELPFPTVSLIHGFCLGGGLELAMACTYRVAEDDQRTRFGLPEVNLGIHPGFGGTVRLPRLVGTTAAMDMMLTGRTLDAKKAKKIGLVDFVTPSRHLKTRARMCVMTQPSPPSLPLLQKMTNHTFVRPVLKRILTRKVENRAPADHYPAPHAIINIWADHFDNPRIMLTEEAFSVARLIIGPTARNLIRLFFLREKLKSLGRKSDFSPSRVHVIGAGTMGGDIAAWCALRGFHVTLQDREAQYIAPAIKRAYDLYKKRLRRPRLVQEAMDRLMPDINGKAGLSHADVIIEAIFEDVDAKRNLYREIEPRIKADALLGTNTSSIPLEEISQALSKPERLVGLHFFNPVAKMPLVEIVANRLTNPEEINRAAAFAAQIDRLPLPVKSTPGFLVNRILMPYLMEAVIMEEEGINPLTIDRAALDFGMPMGPILLADTVGLDICLHVAEIMSNRIGGAVPNHLRELVEAGQLGKKSERGFYRYKKGKPAVFKTPFAKAPSKDVTDRLMLRMVNEAVACLRESVVENEEFLDAGIVFGTGFAPFRGGPAHYFRTQGIDRITDRLIELEKSYGERFHPDEGWSKLPLMK